MTTFLNSRSKSGVTGVPRILLRSGIFQGRFFPIASTPFTIGSDPEASVPVPDTLVSKRHAEIFVDGNEYWIRDLDSTNGTKVGGYELPKGGKFKLHHRDHIYVAHYAMVFDDGSGLSREKYLWTGGAAAAAILLLSVLVYRVSHPPANVLIHEATELARSGQFEEARSCLDRADKARRADVYRLEAQALGARVDKWVLTREGWAKATETLGTGDWAAATNCLKKLDLADEAAWSWNESGLTSMKEAARAAGLLDGYLAVRDGAEPAEKLRGLLDRLEGEPPLYLARLVREGRSLIGFREKFVLLDKLNTWPPALGEVADFLTKVKAASSGAMAQQVGDMLQAVKGLSDCMARYQVAAGLLRDLKASDALAADLELPEPVAGVADRRISAARDAMARHFKILSDAAQLILNAEPAGRATDKTTWQMEAWKKDGRLDAVLHCDTLSKERPGSDRSQPVGEYDRILGAEAFFSFCMDAANRTQLSPLKTPFQPGIASARESSARIREALVFADRYKDESWQGGALAEKLTGWRAGLAQQDAFARELAALAGASTGRPAIISAAMAAQLAEQPDRLKVRDQSLNAWLAQEFKKSQENLQTLGDEYEKAAADRKAAIARQVLSEGLPFDPVVMRMWNPLMGADLFAKALGKPVPGAEPEKVKKPDPPKQDPPKPDPPKVVRPPPPVQPPPDPNAGKRADLLKRVAAADTPGVLAAVVQQFEKWEAEPGARPDAGSVTAIEKAIREKCAVLCDREVKQAKKAYDALDLDKGDDRAKVITQIVDQTAKRYGKDELLVLVKDVKAARTVAGEKKDKLQAEKDARTPKPDPVPVTVGAMGTLAVVTTPSEAQVFVDGKLVENKMVAVDPNVNHKVRIECPGYKPHEQSYRVQAGQKRTLEILLQKEEKKGMFGW